MGNSETDPALFNGCGGCSFSSSIKFSVAFLITFTDREIHDSTTPVTSSISSFVEEPVCDLMIDDKNSTLSCTCLQNLIIVVRILSSFVC